MSHSIRGRLERLEQRRPSTGDGFCRHFWHCITITKNDGRNTPNGCAGKVCGFSQERLADMFSGRAHAEAMESHPAGIGYRKELRRLGLAQPESLGGIDLYAECLRLGRIPTPAAANVTPAE
jgi:hypothetical protein